RPPGLGRPRGVVGTLRRPGARPPHRRCGVVAGARCGAGDRRRRAVRPADRTLGRARRRAAPAPGRRPATDRAVRPPPAGVRARLAAAAVPLPALGVVLGTDGDEQYAPPTGHSGVPGGGLLPPRDGDRPRIVLSASRPPAFADAVADAVGGDLVPLGSAGAKTAAVVRGEADAYIHAGGQYQWDSAAPAGVALARGFVALRVNGDPLRYNVGEVYLPDLVVCRADLADAVLGAIASVA